MSSFVIRRFEFGYNDEWYETDGELGRITAVFDDEASAQAELEHLVAKFWRGEELSSYGMFCDDVDEALVEKLNAFCLAHCGQPLADEDGDVYTLPPGLSDAHVLEFAKIAGLMAYQVVEVPDNGGFVALWWPEEERYLGNYVTEINYQPSIEALMANVPDQLYEALPDSWQGSYEDISHSPLLLRQLVSTQPDVLHYDESKQCLSFTKGAWSVPGMQLLALNALLKTPVFEVRQLSIQELMDMQA